jgi:hypothetical protein
MIWDGAADITRLVSINYQYSTVGSGQKLLPINLNFFGKMEKVLDIVFI